MSKLTNIPGIGKNMVQHLTDLGYPNVEALKGQDAEDVFREHCLHFGAGNQSCKCVLYCCRLAVHYAGHDGELPPDKQNGMIGRTGEYSKGESAGWTPCLPLCRW